MRKFFALFCCSIVLAGCGVRRPLMKPEDIPAYEEKRARRQQELQKEMLQPAVPLSAEEPQGIN